MTDNPLHILHLTPYYVPAYAFGGVVRAVEGMAQALVARGHRVTVLTTDALNQLTRFSGDMDTLCNGVRVVRVPNLSVGLRGRFNLSTPNKMKQAAIDLLHDVDIVHCHEFRTVENLLVTPVAIEMGIPLVLSPHGTLNRSTGRSTLKSVWDKLLSPAVARRFDHIIGLTDEEITQIRDLWSQFGRRRIPAQFHTIPNGTPLKDFTDLPDGHAFRERYEVGDATIVLFMGRLHARKGVEVLIQAFQKAAMPNTKLVIAGPDEGMLNTLQSMADVHVIFTGYLDSDARLEALAAADVFALPATGEGLSMAVLEAMGAGLPVILSPGCNLPEAETAGAGLIVEPQIEPLSTALRTLLTDKQQRIAMGRAARKLVETQFTWDRVAVQIEAVYRQALQPDANQFGH